MDHIALGGVSNCISNLHFIGMFATFGCALRVPKQILFLADGGDMELYPMEHCHAQAPAFFVQNVEGSDDGFYTFFVGAYLKCQ